MCCSTPLSVAQVLVYIGAISILIIFGVMLTRGMQGMIPRNSQAVGAAVVAAIIFAVLLLLLGPARITINNRDFGAVAWAFANQAVSPEYIGKLGIAFVDVNQYALPFELASVLILLVLIGSIWVARERRPLEVIEDRMEVSVEEAAEKPSSKPPIQPRRSCPKQPPRMGATTRNALAQHPKRAKLVRELSCLGEKTSGKATWTYLQTHSTAFRSGGSWRCRRPCSASVCMVFWRAKTPSPC